MPEQQHEYITCDAFFAYCALCCDVSNQPGRIDRRGVIRHIESPRHKKNLSRAKWREARPGKADGTEALVSYSAGSVQYEKFAPETPLDEVQGEKLAMSWGEKSEEYHFEQPTLAEDLFETTAPRGHDPPFETPPPSESEISDSEHDIDEEESDWITEAEYTSPPINGPSSKPNPWSPWPSKAYFLAHLLSKSARRKFGRNDLHAIFAFSTALGAKNVPSVKALEKLQAEFKKRFGSPKTRKVSANGNIFYMNQTGHAVAQDMANPKLRKHMNFYLHFNNKAMSQAWHGSKMLEDAPDRLLTPMIRLDGRIFYVNELVQRQDDWFLPLRWFVRGHQRDAYAFGYRAKITELGLHVCAEKRVAVPASTFMRSYPELEVAGQIPLFDDESQRFEQGMPHPLRAVAGDSPVYSIPLIVFLDDASGNVSRQWNKHNCCYMSNGALPREVLQGEYAVRFVATSPHASPLEILEGVKEGIE